MTPRDPDLVSSSRPPPPARFARRAEGARNGCAQAAVATLLAHYDFPEPRLRDLYARFPPDTPFRLLGTSPRRLAQALAAHGLPARQISHRRAAPARAWLEAELAAGQPVVLLLDLRHLGRRLPGGHYVVAFACDEQEVHVTNMVRAGRHRGPQARVPWSELLPAWRCTLAPFPSWHYAAVVAAPPPLEPARSSQTPSGLNGGRGSLRPE